MLFNFYIGVPFTGGRNAISVYGIGEVEATTPAPATPATTPDTPSPVTSETSVDTSEYTSLGCSSDSKSDRVSEAEGSGVVSPAQDGVRRVVCIG